MFCLVKILVQQFVTGDFNPIHIHCFKKKTRYLEPIKDVEHNNSDEGAVPEMHKWSISLI